MDIMAGIAVDTAHAVYMATVVINKAVTVTMGVRKTFNLRSVKVFL